MPRARKFSPTLPVEIWDRIFRETTLTARYYAQPLVQFEDRDDSIPLSLVRVCKHWRSIANKFLYETVWIKNNARYRTFLDALQRSEGSRSGGYGKWVRCLVLPHGRLNRGPLNVRLLDILHLCPHIETIIKLNFEIDDSPSSDPEFWSGMFHPMSSDGCDDLFRTLASLKHLHWCAGNAESFAQLSDFILHSPNLQTLSIHIRMGLARFVPGLPRTSHPNAVFLPSLTTFALLTYIEEYSYLGLQAADMPNLKNFCADPGAMYIPKAPTFLLQAVGHQLRAVQVLPYYFPNPFPEPIIPLILALCPNLEELDFHIDDTVISQYRLAPAAPHTSLTCVRIGNDGGSYRARFRPLTIDARIEEEFTALTSSLFPALRRVVLYGNWSKVLRNVRFRPLYYGLHDSGCTLEYVDGTPIPAHRKWK